MLSRHIACAMGQRGWKRHPAGTRAGLGTSPRRMMRVAPALRIRCGHRRQQRLRVGMVRRVEQRVALGQLHQPAEIHHRDPVRDVPHHRQIVRDEQIRDAEPLLQVLQQVHHLRADRYVQRRHRLVGDDHARLRRHRPRDCDALALAAGELERIAAADAPPRARPGAATAMTRSRRCSRAGQAGRRRAVRRRCPRPIWRGLSDAYGSWNTICISRRRRRSAR